MSSVSNLTWVQDKRAEEEELEKLLDPFFQDVIGDPWKRINSYESIYVTPFNTFNMLTEDQANKIEQKKLSYTEPLSILNALNNCRTNIKNITQEILCNNTAKQAFSPNKLVIEIKEDEGKKQVAKIASCWEQSAISVARQCNGTQDPTPWFKEFWGARYVAYKINECLSSKTNKYRCYACIYKNNCIEGLMLTSQLSKEFTKIDWLMSNPANLRPADPPCFIKESIENITPIKQIKGVGKALVDKAKLDCKNESNIGLFVNPLDWVKDFYKKNGFIDFNLGGCKGMFKEIDTSK